MKADKWRQGQPRAGQNGHKWRQQGQPRASQNGDHKGRQMKAAKSRPEWRSQRETNEGRLGGSVRTPIASSYLGNYAREQMKADKWRRGQPRAGQNGHKWRQQGQPRASQNGDHKGRQMKAAKSRPEWRPRKETNEGGQMKAAKRRPEWRSQRETNEGRLGGSGRLRSKNPYSFQLSGEQMPRQKNWNRKGRVDGLTNKNL